MPKSYRSVRSPVGEDEDRIIDTSRQPDSQDRASRPQSPLLRRRTYSTRSMDYRALAPDENSSLLEHPEEGDWGRSYRSIPPSTPGTPRFQRQQSYSTNARLTRNLSRGDSYTFSQRLVTALGSHQRRETAGIGKSCQGTFFPRMESADFELRLKPWSIKTLNVLY
jgi:hypothetical protein